jgi:glucose-1-phosphate thymidylyltransferase
MENFIGLLPCGGVASRIKPFRYPKQLLPVIYTEPDEDGNARPVLVSEYSIRTMTHAGIQKCIVTVHDWKYEILKYFQDGKEFGIDIAYICQQEPKSLPDAINTTYEWIKQSNVCLAWPDTIYEPFDSISQICKTLVDEKCDLVLGAFPNERPETSFPVYYDDNHNVYKVALRPKETEFKNTCGLAAWSPVFTEFLHNNVSNAEGKEQQIMDMFALAIESGLKVKAVYFDKGSYTDVGIVDGIGSLLLRKDPFPLK